MNLGGFPTYASLTLAYSAYSKAGSEVSFGRERNYAGCRCQSPNFTPDHTNVTLATGVPCSLQSNTNHNPTSFGCKHSAPRFIYKYNQRKHLWHTDQPRNVHGHAHRIKRSVALAPEP